MKGPIFSKATLGRLPVYLDYLRTGDHGENISAAEISRALGLGDVQVRKDLNAVREDFERDKAETQRNRILRFDDELRRKEDHSEEFFNQIQDDISDYLEYCNKHEKFPNGRADSAIHNIRQTYDYCKHNDKFI